MRVLVVANINSTHTKKWLNALKDKGLSVYLFSLHHPIFNDDWYKHLDGYYHYQKSKSIFSNFLVFKYLISYFKLKKCISEFNPDILHSHYLSNYAFIANTMKFRNHVSTAWGSDIFIFPKTNFISKVILKYNLRSAQNIISTSYFMRDEINKYTPKEINVIPFGIDFSLFSGTKKLKKQNIINISCFKKIDYTYGTDLLIQAFKIVKEKLNEHDIRLNIIGDGKEMENVQSLVKSLELTDNVNFLGWQSPDSVPKLLENMDICVYLSRNESFGVSLLEAMASKTPMVVSNIPAFKEVIGSNLNGLFVEVGDFKEAANAIIKLVTETELYHSVANNAYLHCLKHYNLEENINKQINLYNSILSNSK